jgi:transcriptional regulator with XRE-family HTH domain
MTDPNERLRQARIDAGYSTAQDAAAAMGIPYPTYAGHENGTTGMRASVAERYARKFRVSLDWLLTGRGAPIRTVPIAGKAGAGPFGTVAFAESDGNFGEAEAPLNATPATLGLEVEGESMRGIAENGSLIFYDERQPPNETHIGELCICWLEDERVLVKYPYLSREPGLWNLESTTATTLRNVPVRYFAHVINIVPRRAAKSLIRKNVAVVPVDTVISR